MRQGHPTVQQGRRPGQCRMAAPRRSRPKVGCVCMASTKSFPRCSLGTSMPSCHVTHAAEHSTSLIESDARIAVAAEVSVSLRGKSSGLLAAESPLAPHPSFTHQTDVEDGKESEAEATLENVRRVIQERIEYHNRCSANVRPGLMRSVWPLPSKAWFVSCLVGWDGRMLLRAPQQMHYA